MSTHLILGRGRRTLLSSSNIAIASSMSSFLFFCIEDIVTSLTSLTVIINTCSKEKLISYYNSQTTHLHAALEIHQTTKLLLFRLFDSGRCYFQRKLKVNRCYDEGRDKYLVRKPSWFIITLLFSNAKKKQDIVGIHRASILTDDNLAEILLYR